MIFNKTSLRLLWPLLALFALLAPAPAEAQRRFGMWPADAGQALPLKRHDLQVTINHPVVETVLTQEFENSAPFNREATFYYPVPAGATVAGMALWVNGVRRPARMLERQKAREIYDGIVRKNRDPAIVERINGSTFKIRIFPVLARSRTRVELRFVQPVQADARGRYSVTLKKPPGATIHVLRLGLSLRAPFPLSRARLAGYPDGLGREGEALTMARPASVRSFKKEIRISYRDGGVEPAAAAAVMEIGQERLVLAEVPVAEQRKADRRVAILVDRSRTMASHLPRAHRLVERLLGSLADADQAAVVPFGLLPTGKVELGRVGSKRAAMARAVKGLKGKGGTAFVPAFAAALKAGARQIICLTDGGSRYHQAELEALLRTLVDHPGVTVSVITPADAQNIDATADLVRATGGLTQTLSVENDLSTLARRLINLPARLAVEVQGHKGEAHIISRSGGRLLLALRLPAGVDRPTVRLLGGGGRQVQLDLSASATDVRGAGVLYAAAAIDGLMRKIKLIGEEPALREAVVKLSQQHMVLSEYTALLATETDAQFNNPTSGRKWQRKTPGFGDDLPSNSFHSTPEPHEWALIGLAMLALMAARKKGWLGGPA